MLCPALHTFRSRNSCVCVCVFSFLAGPRSTHTFIRVPLLLYLLRLVASSARTRIPHKETCGCPSGAIRSYYSRRLSIIAVSFAPKPQSALWQKLRQTGSGSDQPPASCSLACACGKNYRNNELVCRTATDMRCAPERAPVALGTAPIFLRPMHDAAFHRSSYRLSDLRP